MKNIKVNIVIDECNVGCQIKIDNNNVFWDSMDTEEQSIILESLSKVQDLLSKTYKGQSHEFKP